ncbi:hypothetical protein FHS39_002598 [Streptomyces olivoverticillatus]|uniref:HK97 gp10 family phage protein n=1 Tax=Streptomyces olivoverticillatus TaxID=66427 RepID=A0A7W7PKT4_9ACTN|nr:hypothetical protein [Streptomyces olivoverticillatus]MBB4893567.1 hypothetical protein [Streptomyces olivoverticillatus]
MAVPELRPGMFTRLVTEIDRSAQLKTRTVLTRLAGAIERQAKVNASNGSHPYGTRTPARPGAGPAVISGTLRRSLTHTPVAWTGGGWETKVGTGGGAFPPYGRGRTPSSRYGLYLETGLRNGSTYPFLRPAFRFGVTIVAPQLYQAVFRPLWPRI